MNSTEQNTFQAKSADTEPLGAMMQCCSAENLHIYCILAESPISAHLQDSNDPFVTWLPLWHSFVHEFDTELCTFQGMLTLAVAYFLETGVREAFCRPRKLEDKPQLVEKVGPSESKVRKDVKSDHPQEHQEQQRP